jgi:hypothetical protein
MTHSSKVENKHLFFMILLGALFALGLFDLVYSFTGAYSVFGILYPAAHALLNIILFLALSFIWSKERWAAWLFLGIVVAHLGLDLAVGAFEFFKLILFLPAIYFLIKIK